MHRTLSYTEVSTALRCPAQWDFAYGGRLAGCTLKPRETAPILSDGRAWGAGVAAWHANSGNLLAPFAAFFAMDKSYRDDAEAMRQRGVQADAEALVDSYWRLATIFEHYTRTADALPNLTQLEGELNVPIPSRAGKRGSNRYRFHCYVDGVTVGEHDWIVEFKLRNNLTPLNVIERQPQYRWYALAYALSTGTRGPVGVILDERLNAAPQPARILKDGKVSHATQQVTTPELYVQACRDHGEEPKPETVAALSQRQWHQRTRLLFTPDELAEAVRELTSAARLISDLDSGLLYPIRNGSRQNCSYCKYPAPCADPTNDFTIDALFERTVPKRLRGPKPEGVR